MGHHGVPISTGSLEMRGLFVNVGNRINIGQKVRVAEFLQPPKTRKMMQNS